MKDLKKLLQKHTGKSIKDCIDGIKPILDRILNERPILVNLHDDKDKQCLSALHLESKNACMYDIDEIRESSALRNLIQMTSKYIDLYFYALLCAGLSMDSLRRLNKSARKSEAFVDNKGLRVALNTCLILLESSKVEYFCPSGASRCNFFFESVNSESVSSQNGFLSKCGFSSVKPMEGTGFSQFAEACIDSFSRRETFSLKSKGLFEKVWKMALSGVEKSSKNIAVGPECANDDLIIASATVRLLSYKTAVQKIFPICNNPAEFADLLIGGFESASDRLSKEAFASPGCTEYDYRSEISQEYSSCTKIAANAIECVYTLVVNHNIDYYDFFEKLLPIMNIHFVQMYEFESLFSIVSTLLSGPLVTDIIAEKYMERFLTLGIACTSEQKLLRILDLSKRIMDIHPSLQIPKKLLADNSVVPSRGYIEKLCSFLYHPSESIRKKASSMVFMSSERVPEFDGRQHIPEMTVNSSIGKSPFSEADPSARKAFSEVWSI